MSNLRNFAVLALAWYLLRRLRRRLRVQAIDRYFIVGSASVSSEVVGRHSKDIALEDIPAMVGEMRDAYASGVSRPIAVRLEQLRALLRLLEENESAILAALHKDLGRPKFESLYYDNILPISEVRACINHLYDWVAPDSAPFSLLTFPSTDEIYKEPLGTVLVIGTWNYPIMLSLVPVAGAIAAGNNAVLKPCMTSPNCAHLIADLCKKYLDPKIVQVVGTAFQGDRQCTHALMQHPFDHVFFTGSPTVGKVVMQLAANHLTPVTLELGGKNPVLVDKDADLVLAAQRIVWGRMMNAGQQCIAPDTCLVHESVIDELGRLCGEWIRKMYTDDPQNAGTVGRIVGAKQMKRLIEVLETHGGEVLVGGTYDEEDLYIAPSVVKVARDSPCLAEETFGPILILTPVASMQEAIEYVNARPKPLSMYVFSSSHDTQERIVQNTSAGGVTINACLFHVGHSEMPFGGVGNSGMGTYHGKHTFDTFCHRKPVLRKSIWPDGGALSNPFFLYPPFTDFKIQILRMVGKLL